MSRVMKVGRVVALFWLVAVWALMPVTAQVVAAQGAPVVFPQAPEALQAQMSRHIWNGNFKVERGQVIDESVIVYSGNVELESGARIAGTLVVMSGDVEIEEGASVDGDVTTYSGDIKVDGRVGGNVASMSGNIELDDSARVEGDVSVLSGRVRRADGAYVGGNVVQRPGMSAPATVAPPVAPGLIQVNAPRTSLLGAILGVMARLLAAVLLTGFVAALAAVVFTVWPSHVARTRVTLEEQRPLSFVIGLFGNLTVLFLAGILTVTVCLAPFGVLLVLALAVANLMGWTVAAQIVGERVVKLLKQDVQPVLTVVVGAVLLTGAAALLWVFDCLRPLAFLFMLVVASFGTGALLVPWVNRRRGDAAPTPPPVDAGGEAGPPPAPLAVWQPPVSAPVVQTPEASAPREVDADATPVVDEPAVPAETETPTSAVTAGEPATRDDQFTRIKGVGPVFERRLKAAGILTFADLAAAQPETIAEIIGWPVDRVLRSELREQALRLAQGG